MMDQPMPPPNDMYVGKNYYSPMSDSSGFKYRVDGRDVINEVVESLRGGVRKGKYGRSEQTPEFKLMNDLGISRASAFLRGVVNKNTHLSRYPDKDTIMSQVRSLAKEWCVTGATNRKHWEIKDPDLVQQIMETAILSALLRADEGFEAEISGKSHSVVESVTNMTGQQQPGFFARLNPFRGW